MCEKDLVCAVYVVIEKNEAKLTQLMLKLLYT